MLYYFCGICSVLTLNNLTNILVPLLENFTKFCIEGIYLAETLVLKLLDRKIYNAGNGKFDKIVPI